MTGRCSRPAFSCPRLLAAALLPLVAMLSACGSQTTANTAVPVSASGAPAGAIDTGTYPNLNIPPRTAAPQISDTERKSEVDALQAARQGQPDVAGQVPPKDESSRLRSLGRSHARDTLKAIESAD